MKKRFLWFFLLIVLFCKKIIEKKKEKEEKIKIICFRNLTSPLRRIREHGEKLILPTFADFCQSDSLTHSCPLSENIGI